jgi:hypothetical protein
MKAVGEKNKLSAAVLAILFFASTATAERLSGSSPARTTADSSDDFDGDGMSDTWEIDYVIHCYRLHKILKSLGDSVSLKFSNVVVEEYVDMAIAVSCTLHDR